jgi:acid phosphatase family membrane protein YuiD
MGNIWDNYGLWIPIITWALVQSIKVLSDLIIHKKLNIKRLWGSGGMPSSHSAFVMSLSTVAALSRGLDSLEFAICLIFSGIVMYDAAGVRRAAGKQAKVLNQIIESDGDINIQEKLVELLGHTPVEVFAGAVVGVLMAIALYNFWM